MKKIGTVGDAREWKERPQEEATKSQGKTLVEGKKQLKALEKSLSSGDVF